MILKFDGNTAVVRADSHTNRIFVAVDGPAGGRRGALSAIRDCFKAIHGTVPRLIVSEMVAMPDAPELTVSYQHLLELEQDREPKHRPDGARKSYDVAELLNGIEDPARREKDFDRKWEFLRDREDRHLEKTMTPPAPEVREAASAPAQSPLKMAAGVVALIIMLLAALVWLANQVGENAGALGLLGALAVLVIYPPLLFAALSTKLIGQKTFSTLTLGVLDKLAGLKATAADGDD